MKDSRGQLRGGAEKAPELSEVEKAEVAASFLPAHLRPGAGGGGGKKKGGKGKKGTGKGKKKGK